jgi:hypothetical protein
VVTDTLHDCCRTGVADAETLGSNTAKVAGTASGAVQADITNENVFLGTIYSVSRWIYYQATTRETFSHVVVGITLKFKSDTWRKVRTERLASGSTDVGMDSVLRQASLSVSLADMVRKSSAKRTVGVDDIALNASGKTLFQGKLRLRDELVVEADMKTVILLADIKCGDTRAEGVRRCQDER